MTLNIRYIVIFFFLLMGFVPFLLMTDLFPFMRFGMFAETIQALPQKEVFNVEIIRPDGTKKSLSERQIGLDDSHLNYLARQYYYKQQLPFFAEQLKASGLVKPDEKVLVTLKTLNDTTWKDNVLLTK
jgi:hypothetical protein